MLMGEAEVISPELTHLPFGLDCGKELIGVNSTKAGAVCSAISVEN